MVRFSIQLHLSADVMLIFISLLELFSSWLLFKLENTILFKVVVIWVVMLCSDVVGYQCFRGLCFLSLQGEANIRHCENLVSHRLACSFPVYSL